MSKARNNVSGVLNDFTRLKNTVKSGAPLAAGSGSPNLSTPGKKSLPASDRSLRTQSFGAKELRALSFGKPSSSSTTTASSTSELTTLLKQTGTGGLSSFLGGGGLLGGLLGVGSVTSLLGNLFGGSSSKSLPTLTRFALPQGQAETFSIGGNAKAMTGMGTGETSGGTYTTQGVQSTSAAIAATPHQDQIAQAVKLALLHSSSLNDVINEV